MKILKITFISFFLISLFSACQKEYSVEGGNLSLAGGTWQFQQGAAQYSGNIDSAYIKDYSGAKVLSLVGKSLNGQENFAIQLYTTDSFKTGSYASSAAASQFNYFTSAKTIYKGDFLAGTLVVNIVSLSNNSIVGNFSGQVEDSVGNLTQITLGSFVSSINLSNNGGQGSGISAGTLGATSGACTPATLSGIYMQGKVLNDSNTVQIQVSVTTPGAYVITAAANTGVGFSSAGAFVTTGVQNITLNGTGTPLNAGVQTFTITYGTSTCSFTITFLPAVVSSLDYFPTTVNSNWVYGLEGGTTADSTLNLVLPDSYTFGTNTYTAFSSDNIPPSGSSDTSYFRKTPGDYFQYVDAQNYVPLDAPVRGEFIFLKDNVAAGTVFRSQDFTGTSSSVPITFYIQVTINKVGATETIGSSTYNEVIEVGYSYFVGGTSIATEEKWFAKGVGLIYDNDPFGDVYNLGRKTIF